MHIKHLKNLTIAVGALATFHMLAPSPADARPSTRSYTCAGVKNLIRARGAVVMNHKNSRVYQRFVHSWRYCRRPNNATRSFRVPTKTGSCSLKVCTERRPLFYDN